MGVDGSGNERAIVRIVPKGGSVLTIIVPVYNEVETLGELLERVLAAPYDKQLILVDDCSTDGSTEILEAWTEHPQVELFRHSKNRGRSRDSHRACTSRGRFTIIQDADLEYDPQEYPRLIEPLLSGEVEVVYGSAPAAAVREVRVLPGICSALLCVA